MYRKRSPAAIHQRGVGIRRRGWNLLLVGGLSSGLLTLCGGTHIPLTQQPVIAAPPTSATPYIAVQSKRIANMELQIWQRINQIRVSRGLQPLQANLPLIQVARAHSQNMARQGCYSHECFQGGNHRQRVQKAGVPAEQVAETLYKVSRPKDLVNLTIQVWMQSPKHQQLLLLPELSETGVAIWHQGDTYYVTQIAIQPPLESVRPPNFVASRQTFETQFKQADLKGATKLAEEWQMRQIGQQLELPLQGTVSPATVGRVANTLRTLAQQTGERAAVIYGVSLQDQLHLLLVLPGPQPIAQAAPTLVASVAPTQGLLTQAPNTQVIHRFIRAVSRSDVLAVTQQLQRDVSDLRQTDTTTYLASAQKLHQWLISPLESHLKTHHIDTLLFAMDDGLRSIPFAALHDGQQFLIEKYRMALIPSFGLTETRPTNLKTQSMLAMGISKSTQGLPRLPAVPSEISMLADRLWQGRSHATLNEQSTLANLKSYNRQQRYGIIHLATHAEFRPGQVDNSFIQFWNRKLTLGQLTGLSQELRWQSQPAVEMLVFSACQTALGNKEAELGFAGSALKAGVRSTIASLWLVNDEGSLGLMTKFYDALRHAPTKAEALRQAQIAMIHGTLHIKDGQLQLSESSRIPLPTELAIGGGERGFSHPYFWAAYTVVGNWH